MQSKAAPISPLENEAPPRWPWYAALTAVYLLAAGALAWFSRDALNPDGVSYVQAARHYAAGRLDLAVTGWFSPLLSWMLVPACWLGVEPFLAARFLGALYGVFFAWGTVRLAGALGGARYALWAYAAALLLSLRTVFAEITPDFLMTVGLTWYFVLTAGMIRGGSTASSPPSGSLRRAALAGLVGGACYYAKAYALPVVVAHLALTMIVRWAVLRRPAPGAIGARGTGLARIAGPPALAMGVAVLLCAPWIAIISAQFGRFTMNTSGSLTSQTWLSGRSGVPRVGGSGNYPHFLLQQPREGRVSVWENPAEARGEWYTWPKGSLSDRSRWLWQTIRFNLGEMATFFSKPELLGLLAIGAMAAVVLGVLGRGGADARTPLASAALVALAFLVILWGTVTCFLTTFVVWTNDLLLLLKYVGLLDGTHEWQFTAFEIWSLGVVLSIPLTALAVSRARRPGIPRELWIWGGLSAAVYVGGYLLLYLYERFLWGAWGMLIALAAGLLTHFAGAHAIASRPPGGKRKEAPPSSKRKTVCKVVAAVVLVSVGVRLAEKVYNEVAVPMSESHMGAWFRQLGETFPQKGKGVRIASNQWGMGLYFCYWSGSVFLGQYPPSFESRQEADAWGRDPGRELRPLSPLEVMVFEPPDRPELAAYLKQAPPFRLVSESREPRSGLQLTEFGLGAAGRP